MDRNELYRDTAGEVEASPPARVAWIETMTAFDRYVRGLVATREGGVDRNVLRAFRKIGNTGSPPARVAWIETRQQFHTPPFPFVATREGGVDRNAEYLT